MKQESDLRYIPKLPGHNSGKRKDIYTHIVQIIINKTFSYSLIWNVNVNLYMRYNPMSWVIQSLGGM